MVGVAGKSKACHDCKRRRVKCGFERPTCMRCVKAGIACCGYDTQAFFINSTVYNPHVSALETLARSAAVRTVQKPISIDNELDILAQMVPATSCETAFVFRSRVFKLLQRLYLPQPAVADNDPNTGAPFSWVQAVCQLEDPDEVLDHALITFCTAQVHLAESQTISYEEALETYNRALGILCGELASQTPPKPDYTLASIVVLSTCELFLCPNDAGWRAHMQGIAELLRQRKKYGPVQVSSGVWQKLASRLRVMCVLSQLTRRQPGSMRTCHWAELMPDDPETEPLDQVLELSTELPSIYEAADVLVSLPDPTIRHRVAIIEALVGVMSNIYTWQAELRQSYDGPLHTTAPSQLVNPADEAYPTKLFPFSIHFRSLQVASYFIVSWGILLQVHASLLKIGSHFGNDNVDQFCITDLLMQNGFRKDDNELQVRANLAVLPPGSIKDEADRLARYLCQSIEYCHMMDKGTFGPQTMLYSRWISQEYFRQVNAERELQWCLNVKNMHGMPNRCNMELMVFQGDRV